MKYLYCIFFVNILIANSESTTVGLTIVADTVSDVRVNPTSITTQLDDIFDLRKMPYSQVDFDDVMVTYQTNTSNQELTLTSANADNNNFYLHHTSHTNTARRRILLRINQNSMTAKLYPNRALASTSDTVLDGQLTLNIKFRTNPANAANAGSYSSDLNITWRSTN